jgi:hypothetical protein
VSHLTFPGVEEHAVVVPSIPVTVLFTTLPGEQEYEGPISGRGDAPLPLASVGFVDIQTTVVDLANLKHTQYPRYRPPPSILPSALYSVWHNLRLIHLPVHASWLNQIEIYFSVVQRKVLNPNDFADLGVLGEHLIAFQEHYERAAEPFAWKFTRHDLNRLLSRLAEHQPLLSSSAAA